LIEAAVERQDDSFIDEEESFHLSLEDDSTLDSSSMLDATQFQSTDPRASDKSDPEESSSMPITTLDSVQPLDNQSSKTAASESKSDPKDGDQADPEATNLSFQSPGGPPSVQAATQSSPPVEPVCDPELATETSAGCSPTSPTVLSHGQAVAADNQADDLAHAAETIGPAMAPEPEPIQSRADASQTKVQLTLFYSLIK
jgi:hypothetical protein